MGRIEITCFNEENGRALTEVYYGFTEEEALEDMKQKIGRRAQVVSCAKSDEILREIVYNPESLDKTLYSYVTNHGLGLGAVPIVGLVKSEDLGFGKTMLYYDRVLTNDELDKYDIKNEWER